MSHQDIKYNLLFRIINDDLELHCLKVFEFGYWYIKAEFFHFLASVFRGNAYNQYFMFKSLNPRTIDWHRDLFCISADFLILKSFCFCNFIFSNSDFLIFFQTK